jgi:hypothetical protein
MDVTTRMMRNGTIAIVMATLVLVACTTPPPQPQSQRDSQANFAAFQTYGWQAAPQVNGQDAPLQLLDQNIRAAIAAEMQKRGYAESATNPDLTIAYETASAQKIENSPVRVGVGVGGWGGSGGGSIGVSSASVRNYQEGTLVIHAIDSERNAEVWQGSISGKMNKGGIEQAAVQRAVAAAMTDFPARTASAQQPPSGQ